MARTNESERRRQAKVISRRGQREDEQRRHRRFTDHLPVRIFKRGRKKDEVSFSASVDTGDISVGGVFLRSTFFLKKGMEVDLEIDIVEMKRTIKVQGTVARIIDDADDASSGFAIKFESFEGDSEIYLRAYLTQGDVFAFVEENANKILPGVKSDDRGRLVELIVRWEIYQESIKR